MSGRRWLGLFAAAVWLAVAPAAMAQPRPYIGYAYPAGGQQGTTFRIKLGGQGLDEVHHAWVTGPGVTFKVLEYRRQLNPQEIALLNEQLRELKRAKKPAADTMMMGAEPMMDSAMMSENQSASAPASTNSVSKDEGQELTTRIESRLAEYVNRPASVALANIVYAEVTIAADAPPGARELRLGTARGVSNPLVFHVGQLPEVSRKAMITAPLQVLGKESLALRKRPESEVEEHITLPCTVNGQIASGERNRYRFEARRGQNLVIATQARQLIPYIADAVPGWFQPVLAIYDARGKEVAYADDFRFKPDPAIGFSVPQDGEYVLEIYDSIYRGREDFVYRVTLGEVPFVTSLFPLGMRTNTAAAIQMKGWNLEHAVLTPPGADAGPGVYPLAATRQEAVSNPLPFAVDTLPETLDKDVNNTLARAQKVKLPIIINGKVSRPGEWNVYAFTGKSNQTIVAEVAARRLESPLDSMLKLTDATGRVLAVNDDCEDPGAGVNTHDADSYLMTRLPADGTYYAHLGDTAGKAGDDYGFRLRLSAPQPDFALRVVPSSLSLRSKNSGTVSVYLQRKDGFSAPVKVSLQDPPAGFTASPVTLSGTQAVARLTIKTTLRSTDGPVHLCVAGTAKNSDQEMTRQAVPAEDRMQAFLWRHLVPASELAALVFDPSDQPRPKRVARVRPASPPEPPAVAATTNSPSKPKFSKQQVAGRLRQLRLLYEEGLLTDEFHQEKVAECEQASL